MRAPAAALKLTVHAEASCHMTIPITSGLGCFGASSSFAHFPAIYTTAASIFGEQQNDADGSRNDGKVFVSLNCEHGG